MAPRPRRKRTHTRKEPSPDPIVLPSSPLAPHSATSGSALPSRRVTDAPFALSPPKMIAIKTGREMGMPSFSPERARRFTPSRHTRLIAKSIEVPETSFYPSKSHWATVTAEDHLLEKTHASSAGVLSAARGRRSQSKQSGNDEMTAVRSRKSRLSHLQKSADTTRSRRLVAAREELDQALQKASGTAETRSNSSSEPVGDLTLSMNEDFSIVSFKSLQTAKEASMAQVMDTITEPSPQREDVLLPRTLPRLGTPQYPDISREATKARSPVKVTLEHSRSSPDRVDVELYIQSRLKKQIEKAKQDLTEPVGLSVTYPELEIEPNLAAEDDTEPAIDVGFDMGEDIWQDEASRSLEDEGLESQLLDKQGSILSETTLTRDTLLSRQPLRPPRAKIPKTWRRSSGVDLSYVDSPAQDDSRRRKQSNGSTDESRIPTPPRTDEEISDAHVAATEGRDAYTHSDLTEPDAEATQLKNHVPQTTTRDLPILGHRMTSDPLAAKGRSPSCGNQIRIETTRTIPVAGHQLKETDPPLSQPPSSPTNDYGLRKIATNNETGLAQREERIRDIEARRELIKRKRSIADDLQPAQAYNTSESSPKRHKGYEIENLALDGLPPMARASKSSISTNLVDPRSEALQSKDIFATKSAGMHEISTASTVRDGYFQRKARREMERQRKMEEQRQQELTAKTPPPLLPRQENPYIEAKELPSHSSMSRKQTALSSATQNALRPNGIADSNLYIRGNPVSLTNNDASRSYEEHLNVESPKKVNINFNDSSDISTLHIREKQYSPLFDRPDAVKSNFTAPKFPGRASEEHEEQDTVESLAPPASSNPHMGILARIQAQLQCIAVGPVGPSEIIPQPVPTAATIFSSNLRAQLRNRYGVVAQVHPWTMCHMRTLHRMLNSLTSKSRSTIIPREGPLVSYLSHILNTIQTSVTGERFLFTTEHAYVVSSFFQITVPTPLIVAMEKGEVEYLGDSVAEEFRGYYAGDPRHGKDTVWTQDQMVARTARSAAQIRAVLTMNFVVQALGDVVCSNKRRRPEPEI